ncbi:hypothetical protein V8G54_035459 [Vigna mungo]|uniref:Non-specific lipid-transfer protein n=1 Tax=Vigna mungo TaxID=3915 RepID=A0AAQ3MFH4_VIGMU
MKPVKGFSCVEAKLSLLTCLPFLTSSQESPSTACCNAVSNVRASAPTKPELREACQCLTAAVGEFPNLDKDRAIQLPKLCNVDDLSLSKSFEDEMDIENARLYAFNFLSFS